MRRWMGVLAAVAAVTAAACGSDQGSERTSPEPSPSTTSAGTTSPPGEALTLRYGDLRQRAVDIDADGRNAVAVVAALNAFAVDLYRTVAAGHPGNVVVGPYSAASALSMIHAGARGQTAQEMAAVLHADLPPADWHEGMSAYDLSLDARTAGSPTTWTAANKVWARPGLPLLPTFLDVLTGSYGSPLAEADFAAGADAQRAVINRWVAERTAGRIPELFPGGSLTAQTVLVLVNAVALDAPWEFPFDPSHTRTEPFTRPDGTVVQVPMMYYGEYLPSAQGESWDAVELPYGGGALSMVVVVPDDLATFETSLTPESLAAVIDAIEDGGIHLSLPRWTARTHVRLDDALAALGMPTAFSGAADFSGMVGGGGLWLDRVEHEAYVEVDEEGTRAAAATGGGMPVSHGPTVMVDRPFLYVIRDRGAGAILFIGRVTDPSAAP